MLLWVLSFVVASENLGLASGTFIFNNLSNTNSAPDANSGGLVFVGGKPLNFDVNFSLRITEPNTRESVTYSWLRTDGTASGISVGNGLFADPTKSVFTVPWAVPGGDAIFELQAWTGNHENFSEALAAGEALGFVGFHNPFGATTDDAASLTGMPVLNLAAIPEPSSFELFGIGAIGAGLLAFRRRHRD